MQKVLSRPFPHSLSLFYYVQPAHILQARDGMHSVRAAPSGKAVVEVAALLGCRAVFRPSCLEEALVVRAYRSLHSVDEVSLSESHSLNRACPHQTCYSRPAVLARQSGESAKLGNYHRAPRVYRVMLGGNCRSSRRMIAVFGKFAAVFIEHLVEEHPGGVIYFPSPVMS